MSIAKDAIAEADEVVAGIFSLAKQTVQERRKSAAWFYVRASRRAVYATTRFGRWYWTKWAMKWKADMEANEATACNIRMAMLSAGRRV
jgi:hypothetical protein